MTQYPPTHLCISCSRSPTVFCRLLLASASSSLSCSTSGVYTLVVYCGQAVVRPTTTLLCCYGNIHMSLVSSTSCFKKTTSMHPWPQALLKVGCMHLFFVNCLQPLVMFTVSMQSKHAQWKNLGYLVPGQNKLGWSHMQPFCTLPSNSTKAITHTPVVPLA